MCLFLDITNEKYTHAGYLRKEFLGQNLFKRYAYKEILIDVTNENRIVEDKWMQILWRQGILKEKKYRAYLEEIDNLVGDFDVYTNSCDQEIYHDIAGIRDKYVPRRWWGKIYEVLEQYTEQEPKFINQIKEEARKIACCTDIIFYVSDIQFLELLIQDIEKYKERSIYLLLKKQAYFNDKIEEKLKGHRYQIIWENTEKYYIDFSKISDSRLLSQRVKEKKVLLLAYGEEALLSIKDLRINSIVNTTSRCVTSKTMINNFSEGGISKIFIPKNYNIYPYTKISEKTKISYYHLAKLASRFGDEIYNKSYESLVDQYPEYFINIYDDNMFRKSIFKTVIRKRKEDEVWEFRDRCIHLLLKDYPNLTYKMGYFQQSNLEERSVDWEAQTSQEAILVHAAILHKITKSSVVNLGEGESPRKYFRKNDKDSIQIISNFLFFTTNKTIALHNRLRNQMPLECIENRIEHVDYLRIKESEKKRESFPLYNKSCIGMSKDGRFKIFRFLLGAGAIQINGVKVGWEVKDINVEGEETQTKDVIVYTPYLSKRDIVERYSMTDSLHYEKLVGKQRLNIAFSGDYIYCIKKGEILMPANGVVISLAGDARRRVEDTLSNITNTQYFNTDQLKYAVNLEPPNGISNAQWKEFEWIYGGAMTLIENGKATFDEGTIVQHMMDEGWETPLSMQTQEADVQNLSIHPRTAVGLNKKGELFILVFSGRTNISLGADYLQMIKIAEKMIPDIDAMVNVDGGASSVLAIVKNSELMELSYPAASDQTCAGVTRNIKTIFNIEL